MGYGYGPQWGMMGGVDGYGWGMARSTSIVSVVIIVAVVALMMWLMRSSAMPGMHRHHACGAPPASTCWRSATPAARSTATNICRRRKTSAADRGRVG